MKNGTETLALAAVAATLTLAACLDEAPAEIAQPDETVAGDPAVYAPDGWPLQIGETTSREQRLRLQKEFLTYGGIVGIHLVGSQVYGARYSSENGPTIYMGHFPKKANWGRESVAERESVLPVRFRGNIEYLPPPSFVRFDEDGEAYVSPEYYEQRGWPADVVNRLRDERRKRDPELHRGRGLVLRKTVGSVDLVCLQWRRNSLGDRLPSGWRVGAGLRGWGRVSRPPQANLARLGHSSRTAAPPLTAVRDWR